MREWNLKPPAQVAEQSLNAEKSPTLQSIGQLSMLHSRVSAECGHALPPALGSVTERLRDCEPLSHDFVQVDHALQLPFKTQSAGHAAELQLRASFSCGHASPPFAGAVLSRLRDCEPVPHDLVQTDQALKMPTTQLTGHACVLQSRLSREVGQALPPRVGSVCSLLRDCEPMPHDFVQVDHALQLPSTTQSTAHA
jgi:hypothetical protein